MRRSILVLIVLLITILSACDLFLPVTTTSTSIPVMQTLSAPAIITATTNLGLEIDLGWSAIEGATYYNLYRSDASDGTYTLIAQSISNNIDGSSGYIDYPSVNLKDYYYKVTAGNATTISEMSAWVHGYSYLIKIPDPPKVFTYIMPPQNVYASDGVYTNKILVTWSGSSNNSYYIIYSSPAPGGIYLCRGTNTNNLFVNNETPGTTNYYKVKAVNVQVITNVAYTNSSLASQSNMGFTLRPLATPPVSNLYTLCFYKVTAIHIEDEWLSGSDLEVSGSIAVRFQRKITGVWTDFKSEIMNILNVATLDNYGSYGIIDDFTCVWLLASDAVNYRVILAFDIIERDEYSSDDVLYAPNITNTFDQIIAEGGIRANVVCGDAEQSVAIQYAESIH